MGVITWIIIGLIAGWLATRIMGRRGSILHNLAVGLVGAILGGWLFTNLSCAWFGRQSDHRHHRRHRVLGHLERDQTGVTICLARRPCCGHPILIGYDSLET